MSFIQRRVLLLLSLVALFAACSTTPTADTDFNPGFDFAPVRQIAILPFDRSAAATVVVSDMQVARVNEDMSAELGRRGFQVVQKCPKCGALSLKYRQGKVVCDECGFSETAPEL